MFSNLREPEALIGKVASLVDPLLLLAIGKGLITLGNEPFRRVKGRRHTKNCVRLDSYRCVVNGLTIAPVMNQLHSIDRPTDVPFTGICNIGTVPL